MRVALIADTLSVERGTGIARYSQALLSGLIQRGLEVVAICPEPPSLPFGLAMNHALNMPYAVRRKAAGFDLAHATSPITALAFPVISKPKVVTYHDLISLLGKDTSSAFHTRLLAPFFLRIGTYADRIIANSSQTKEEIVGHLGIPAQKVIVVLWGVSEIFRPEKKPKQDSYVIGYVGALGRRKALPFLIRAIQVLRASHPELPVKLVICGERKLEYDRLVGLATDLGLNQITEFTGSLTDQDLVNAYNSFDIFVLPSAWEGFGLPILEAQRCGVPVVIRADAHIPAEVARCCLKATSEEDMAEKIYELVVNDDLRRHLIGEGLEYSQRFTWEKTVQETMEVYNQATA